MPKMPMRSPRKALNLIGKRGRLSHAVKMASLLIGLKNRIVAVVVPQASTKGLLSPSDESVSESDLLHCSQNLKAATIYSNNVMTANEFVKFNNRESNN
jgi:poly-D-alanine transfer protein DltD